VQLNLMELAAAEAVAAERRTVAEAVWRSKWWETTKAIGALPVNGVGRELERIAPVLHCSTQWLGSRRRVGAKVALDDDALLAQVPPRLAAEWVRAGRALDADGAKFLIGWESDDRSLRELAAELGTAGRSWATKEELDEREAKAKPSVEQIRAALADPEIAREVVAHGPTRAAFQGATDSWAREATQGTRWAPLPPNVTQTDAVSEVVGNLLHARTLLTDARRALADVPLDDELAAGLLDKVEGVAHEVRQLQTILGGHKAFQTKAAAL
jgi:hypothetical protein